MRVSACALSPLTQSAPMAPGPGVSQVHGAKLQITGRNCSQNLQSSQVPSPRPSLGPSPSLWPIWSCLSSEALPGASVQARGSQGGRRRSQCPPAVDAEAEARAFPAWIFCTQTPSPYFLALKRGAPSTSPAFPGMGGCSPRNPPQEQSSANLLQTRAARLCRTPGISRRCLCLPCRSLWLSPRASLLFLRRVLFHCCLPSSQGSKF